jgi:hypothetical protein
MCYGHHSTPLHQLPQGHLAAINISVGITTETHAAIIIIIIIVIKPEPLLHSPHPKHSLPHPKLEQENKAAAVALPLLQQCHGDTSSKISTGASFRNARAMATRCFCPPLNCTPRSPTIVS